MKILLAHNQYQQAGGEDQSVSAEIAMLESFGHEVVQYRVHNDAIKHMGSLSVATRTIWNRTSYREIRELIQAHRPEIAHFNNTFPLISPAAYYAARKEGVPVIQTLRNFRLICPDAYFLRDQKLCESCLGRMFAWPAIVHGCYRKNRKASAVVATMLATHRLLRTWRNAVDVYIALTEFGRKTFIRGGLPEHKIVVKPNFVYPDPGPDTGLGNYAIFIGRLSEEKGIRTLLDAWRLLDKDINLKIVGSGPLEAVVQEAVKRDGRIEWTGQQSPSEVARLVGSAAFLVFPSLWYEGMPRTIIEAFAKGTPVIASQLGAMHEMITHDENGVHFEPGNATALATLVEQLWRDPTRRLRMRSAARAAYVKHYSSETNHQTLMAIYRQALNTKQANN
jgi:glycosyltransferase involved in cell wall biosynthesis